MEYNKSTLINGLKDLAKDNEKLNIVAENLLYMLNLTTCPDDQLAVNMAQIQSLINSTLGQINPPIPQESDDNGYMSISATVEQSVYDKITSAAKRHQVTINRMLSEWFNYVINNPDVLKLPIIKRLDHTGHQFKRIACCVPKHLVKLLDARLQEAGISRYQCIKIWTTLVDTIWK